MRHQPQKNLEQISIQSMNSDKDITIEELKNHFWAYSKVRGWDKDCTPSLLAQAITIEAADLLEEFQWKAGEEVTPSKLYPEEKQAVTWKVLDVIYYLLLMSKMLNIDISSATEQMLNHLSTRYPAPKRHTQQNHAKS